MSDRRGALLLAAVVIGGGSTAWLDARPQQPKAPEVFVAPMDATGLGPVVNISNNPGYNNQPAFLPNSKSILFSSNRDGSQTDVYRYDLNSRHLTRLTKTEASEYSPLPTPDGKGLSAVQLEPGGAQRLWLYHSDGSKPVVVLDTVTRVGYYAWIDKTRLAVAVLDPKGSAMSLAFADLATSTLKTITTNVGRSLQRRPGTNQLSFVVKPADPASPWLVKAIDVDTRQITTLVATVKGSEDTAWTPDGVLLMAHGTSFYRWRAGDKTWTKLADVPPKTCANVTRLAVSPDGQWLAFVADAVPAK